MVLKGAREFLDALVEQEAMLGAAQGTRDGLLEHSSGTIDGETVCAVATMIQPPISDALAVVGLGSVTQWCVVGHGEVWYVHRQPDRFTIALATSTRNPASTLTSVFKKLNPRRMS